jgi:hypothetical protein
MKIYGQSINSQKIFFILEKLDPNIFDKRPQNGTNATTMLVKVA